MTTNENAGVGVSLLGQLGNPAPSSATLSYSIVTSPSHGTITGFNSATGTLTYTPATGYFGPDSFQYKVTESGTFSGSPLSSSLATVSINVQQVGAPARRTS